MTSTSDPLLQPLRLKTLDLKNRVMSTGARAGLCRGRPAAAPLPALSRGEGQGRAGADHVRWSSTVAPESPSAFGQIDISHDRIIPVLQQFSARIHAHGCALMVQITHMGRRTRWDVADWLPPVAPSPVRELQHRSFPKELEPEDIARIIAAYAAGARRAREGGLDGVELIAQPPPRPVLVAHRQPPQRRLWRQPPEPHALLVEVLEAMRRATATTSSWACACQGDEMLEGGLSREEMTEIAVTHAQSGLIDYLNIVRAHATTDLGISELIPTMGQLSGPSSPGAAEIRAAAGIPVFHATRIADLSTARHAIEAGHVGMVGMTRAHIADPHIVAKLARGEEDRIRPCVGAGYCINCTYVGGDALCIHNAATGRSGPCRT